MLWPLDGPNAYLLRVQGRVCTGPDQSRPLGLSDDDALQPDRALDVILRSARGDDPPEQRASLAQMGAFFAAMRIRRGFDGAGAISDAERHSFASARTEWLQALPVEVAALIEPDVAGEADAMSQRALWPAVRRVLDGEHLDCRQTKEALHHIMSGRAHPALAAALLIGQRMNIEDHQEALAYLEADAPEPIDIDLPCLMHIGQPYNGSTRSFRPALFAAAVTAELGVPTVMHGVAAMPPKDGITELQMLRALGHDGPLDREQARANLCDTTIGFAFVDQEQFSPGRQSLVTLRAHIKKRPVFATTEKLTLLFRATAHNHMICGYFHPGYDDKMLALMRTHELDTNVVFKGREGSTDPTLGARRRHDARAMNQCRIDRRHHTTWHESSLSVDALALGIPRQPDVSPAPAEVTREIAADMAANMGIQALEGAPGNARDSIALSAAIKHHIVARTPGLEASLEAAYAAIDSGAARARMRRYLSTTA
jgi:anthranilate phosphoribosyltransferase